MKEIIEIFSDDLTRPSCKRACMNFENHGRANLSPREVKEAA